MLALTGVPKAVPTGVTAGTKALPPELEEEPPEDEELPLEELPELPEELLDELPLDDPLELPEELDELLEELEELEELPLELDEPPEELPPLSPDESWQPLARTQRHKATRRSRC
jgi:hypothetical protein